MSAKGDLGQFEDPAVLSRVIAMREVATSQFPTVAAERLAWAMAWTHLVIWNSWKATYFFADKYPKDDFPSYRDFAALSVDFLIAHHDAEEETLFPELEKKIPGSMEENEAQHKAFLDGLVDLHGYITSTNESDFKPATLRAKFDNILLPVMTHLAEELPTIEGSKIKQHYDEAGAAQLAKQLHKATRGESTKTLPFVLQNLPPGSPFPPAPKFVTGILGPWAFWWKHKNLWKYTAYPFKQELPDTVPI
ncbi:hypothetical protein PUNSTDRAFT_110553 [Punctularia strigosozonata HHB-11173 SS5]|uniref:uncharacterized protein n=1 Tax=Punctularia strigosozonata (strain HHB-11173) TaxID=741275 RepID=UPI00044186F1|nr:uncharacterized protein PUNSTDRAFT_110553 [Punctularia strigosozonata HHB-11173 SS5]EIN14464.1 hypothetical protein PUNSTDRAFT_110553 [Punctularia strigosozonata HHB-11173 SS5]